MTTKDNEQAQYLLQDSRGLVGSNMSFWAKGGKGYTTDISKAERYSQEAAFARNASRETDIPWPLAYLEPKQKCVVDMQYPRTDEANKIITDLYFVQIEKKFDGNDMYFHPANGTEPTTELAKAAKFTTLEALQMQGKAWPVCYLESLSRFAVSEKSTNKARALGDLRYLLKKPQKYVPARLRCGSCQAFIQLARKTSSFRARMDSAATEGRLAYCHTSCYTRITP